MADKGIAIIHQSNFHHIRALYLSAEIWASLKAGKTTKMISLDTITTNMGTTTCKAMALFYILSGSDSTSYIFTVSDPAACSVSIPERVFLFSGIRKWQFSFPGFPGARE